MNDGEKTEDRVYRIEETLYGNAGGYKEGLVQDMRELKEKQKEHHKEFLEVRRKLAFWNGVAMVVIVVAQIAVAIWLRSFMTGG